MKDDSGSCAVFAEQGSSASQMKAAKVMDVFARLPGCAGQATDAASAYTQNGRSIIFDENSKVRMSRHLDATTQVAKLKVQHNRTGCSSSSKSSRN